MFCKVTDQALYLFHDGDNVCIETARNVFALISIKKDVTLLDSYRSKQKHKS